MTHRSRYINFSGSIFLIFPVLPVLLLISASSFGQPHSDIFSVFEENGSKGLVNSDGKTIIPAVYLDLGWTQGLPEFHQHVIGYRESDKWGLINSNNKIITPPKYVRLYPAGNSSLLVAGIRGKFSGETFVGLINTSGKVIIPFMYADVEIFRDEVIVKTLDGNKSKYGIVNMSNEPILPFIYEQITPLNNTLLGVVKSNHRILIMNSRGKEAIRYEVDSIGSEDKDFFRIYRDGKVGLIDRNGNLILFPDYKKINVNSEGQIDFLHFNKWEYLGMDSEATQTILADDLAEMGQGIFRISIDSQSWLVDHDFNKLSQPYDELLKVSEHHVKSKKSNKYGLLNRQGTEILRPVFDSLKIEGPFVYACRSKGRKFEWDVFDTLGIRKNHFTYQKIKQASEGMFAVKRNDKWGFMTREGMEVIHCVYEEVTSFQNGISVVQLFGEDGIIDRDGSWIILPKKRQIEIVKDTLFLSRSDAGTKLLSISNGLIYFTENPLRNNGNYFSETIQDEDSIREWHISLQGIIINDNARPGHDPILVNDSLIIVFRKGETGVLSSRGSQLVPFGDWDEIYPPSEDFFGIKGEGFYGFVDMDNKLRIANRYEGIGRYKEGLASVMVRGKWGFIDKREYIVCQPLYEEVGEFTAGLCKVRDGKLWGIINKEGKLIQSIQFDSVDFLESGWIITSKDGQYGLLENTGQTVLFPKYDTLKVLQSDMIIAKRKGLFGLINESGVAILPMVYNEIKPTHEEDLFLAMTPGVWETRNYVDTAETGTSQ